MLTIAQSRAERNGNRVVRLTVRREDDSLLAVHGREPWALRRLIEAGERGCTPIEHPGPRWSHYVWKLRGYGIAVATINEAHAGICAGHHARYVERSARIILEQVPVSAHRADVVFGGWRQSRPRLFVCG
jgi:hypothetical protein